MDYRDTYFKWAACQVMAEYLQQEESEAKVTMKDVFIRLFRGHDPLDCITDFTHTTTIDKEEEIVEVVMSIPRGIGPNTIVTSGARNKRVAVGKKLPSFPKRIIFSGPKTIVFWHDGTKTIVSCAEDEEYDPYNAFCSAVVKKMFGTTSAAKKFIKKHSEYYVPKEKKPKVEESEVQEYEIFCGVDEQSTYTVPVEREECDLAPKHRKKKVSYDGMDCEVGC